MTEYIKGYYEFENEHLRDKLQILTKEVGYLNERISAIETTIARNEEEINQQMLELTEAKL